MTKTRTTNENLSIYHVILHVFGGDKECRVQTYWDETGKEYIDIVICPDSPFNHVCSYSTVALSDFSIGKRVDDINLGVEIVGACDMKFDQFPNIISTCAFNIILEHSSCFPGAIYPNIIDIYMPDSPMKHILFVPPFGWDKELETLDFLSKKVAWLLAVPISDPEYSYARKNGSEKLESLFEEKQIDIYDLNRASVL